MPGDLPPAFASARVDSLDDARRRALQLIRTMIANASAEAPLDMRSSVIISDDDGNALLTVPFRDALH